MIYIITRENDGNWKGITEKFGKIITVRDVNPESVLSQLITHDGKASE